MDKNRPIGIFDSGLGGLTVVSEIINRLPKENFIYLGDTARVPYGTRSKALVTKFSLQDTNFLLDKHVKCLVIACNTASALALSQVKKTSDVYVFDAISGVARALARQKITKVGVIGTRGTIGSHAYKKSIQRLNPKIRVYEEACPLLVPAIEEGEISGKLINMLIKKYLVDLKRQKLDALVLGCTHYPIINKQIEEFMGPGVKLIDPAQEISNSLLVYLGMNNLLNSGNKKVKRNYFVTDLTPRFIQVANLFMGQKLNKTIKKVNLGES